MTTDKTPATLATAKHGGCVQLGHAVRALPAEWRERAEELSVDDAIGLTHQLKLKDCADELDAALASMPPSAAMGVTDAMVHAFEDAYCKNWEAQRHAPEGTKELGTFFATRAGLEAALSAQPSPGGQGDAPLRVFSAGRWTYDGTGETFSHDDMDGAAFVVYRDALAARQPVGEPVANPIHQLRKADGSWIDQDKHSYDYNVAQGHRANLRVVYAAPPAQAVDLVDFKALYRAYVRLLESGRDRIQDLGGTCDPVDVMEANDVDLQAARRVLDSQAVGK